MGRLVLSVLVSRGTVVFEVRVRVSRETGLFICQSNHYPATSLFHVEHTIGQSVSSVNRLSRTRRESLFHVEQGFDVETARYPPHRFSDGLF